MATNEKNGSITVSDRSGIGCGLLVLGICLLLILTSDKFWDGLRSVIEAAAR